MLTVNLKPGARRNKPSGLGNALSALKGLPSRIKDPWPIAAIASWVLLAGFLGWVWIGSAMAMGKLEDELAATRSEHRRNRQLLAEKRRAEASRDSVVAQIATIRTVDEDRYVWAHILDEVARAIPPYMWLTDIQPVAAPPDSLAVRTVEVQVSGRTMDLAAFTRFMRELEDSPWLKDISVITTGTEIDHERAVTVFTLKATYTRHRVESQAAQTAGSGGGGG